MLFSDKMTILELYQHKTSSQITMPGYGYMIIFSSQTYDRSSDTNVVMQTIENDSPKIKEINNVFTEGFKDPRYDCGIDHLMLLAVSFWNMKKNIHYNGLYVISLIEITHPLFITNNALREVLDSNHVFCVNDIYCNYPSFRFNKFHVGDYFYLTENNDILFHKPRTNSHGLVR
jgi:hypothetical protein